MPRKEIPSYLDDPRKFWMTLLGFWVFFSVILGFYSTFILGDVSVKPLQDNLEGMVYAGIYAAFLLLLFGCTWTYFHRFFPIYRPENLIYHAIGQVLNSGIAFALGNLAHGLVHQYVFISSAKRGLKEGAIAIIALLCLNGILFINGFFYVRAFLRRSLEAEQRKTESELKALRAQINPHFLFNSLNSIAALVQSAPAHAESVTQDLADLFRYTLHASEKSTSLVQEELEVVNLYLNIEKARFKDRLSVNVSVPEELYPVEVPVLTLQPLLENAIKHGVSRKEGKHIIDLQIKKKEKKIEIRVLDTGPGFPHKNFDKILENGTGLSNVFRRLQLHFGKHVDGAILSNGISIRFPAQNRQIQTTGS